MKKTILTIALSLSFFYGCKFENKESLKTPEKEASILEKIALANGYENWKNVEELKFTFNVDRDTSHFERSWIWNRKANEVTGISLGNTSTYNRKKIDSTASQVDAAFINDKYWLLAPYNLIWDSSNISFEHHIDSEAPMSKKPMQKLTIVYANEGGYTPGDAYDFYFEDDYIFKEWVFRKANQEEPSMNTTWEDYKLTNGLNIASMHQNEDGTFKLYFTDIEVK